MNNQIDLNRLRETLNRYESTSESAPRFPQQQRIQVTHGTSGTKRLLVVVLVFGGLLVVGWSALSRMTIDVNPASIARSMTPEQQSEYCSAASGGTQGGYQLCMDGMYLAERGIQNPVIPDLAQPAGWAESSASTSESEVATAGEYDVADDPATEDLYDTSTPRMSAGTLAGRVEADRAGVEAILDTWVPILSQKWVGLEVDGFLYDEDLILELDEELHNSYGTLLLWSGDYSSFPRSDIWAHIVPTSFTTKEGALDWCRSSDRGRADCGAKFVSKTRPSKGSTAWLP